MNITIFIGSISGGGAERVACQLANHLVSKGHSVKLLTVTETVRNYDIDDRVVLTSLDITASIPKIIRVPLKMWKLRSFICSNTNNDVYVVFLTNTIRALLHFRKLIKEPVIISNRNDPSLYPQKMQKKLFAVSKKADLIVCQTEEIKDYYKQYVPNGRFSVIPNAISHEFKPYYGEREKTIVSVGRFTEQKNFELLLRAFANVKNKHPEYKLIIYGQGSLLEHYIALCKELGISDDVFFPGYVKDVTEKIKNASVFVLSSDFEGIPNALMEALAVGLPCVSTDCSGGGARLLIRDKINGLLVPKGNIELMEEAINYLLENPSYSKRIGEEAVEIAKQFLPEKIYQQWENTILEEKK